MKTKVFHSTADIFFSGAFFDLMVRALEKHNYVIAIISLVFSVINLTVGIKNAKNNQREAYINGTADAVQKVIETTKGSEE